MYNIILHCILIIYNAIVRTLIVLSLFTIFMISKDNMSDIENIQFNNLTNEDFIIMI
jgi:hypothetical protein